MQVAPHQLVVVVVVVEVMEEEKEGEAYIPRLRTRCKWPLTSSMARKSLFWGAIMVHCTALHCTVRYQQM